MSKKLFNTGDTVRITDTSIDEYGSIGEIVGANCFGPQVYSYQVKLLNGKTIEVGDSEVDIR